MPNRLALRRLVPAACLLGLLAPVSASAGETAVLLPPTPLVLKDGRIARVTVHTIPFPIATDQPNEAARAALTALVDDLATDCFLTAQAIGHVEPGPGSDGETLAAHRLARARADNVQAALTARGLPPTSIASVWDWQFAVREPRVTLWVFRLAEGDDCDSRPIAQPAPAAVAEAAPVEEPVAAEEPVVVEPAVVDRPAVVEASAPLAPPQEPATQGMAAMPAPEGATPMALAAPEPEADSPPPVLAEATPATPEPLPAPMEAAAPIGAAAAAEPAQATPGDDAALAITFEVNSSYFPKGASRELKALAESLSAERGYEVVLEGAVSTEPLRSATADKGADKGGHAYNRWIADRRMGRIADWLRRHTNGGGIDIKQAYAENDPSRRVTIRIRPLP